MSAVEAMAFVAEPAGRSEGGSRRFQEVIEDKPDITMKTME